VKHRPVVVAQELACPVDLHVHLLANDRHGGGFLHAID
jgi:hypothetical protein